MFVYRKIIGRYPIIRNNVCIQYDRYYLTFVYTNIIPDNNMTGHFTRIYDKNILKIFSTRKIFLEFLAILGSRNFWHYFFEQKNRFALTFCKACIISYFCIQTLFRIMGYCIFWLENWYSPRLRIWRWLIIT